MGGSTKELNLLDLVRNGDSQAALKILFKNKPKCENIYKTTKNRGHQQSECSNSSSKISTRLRSLSVDCQNHGNTLNDPSSSSDNNRLRYIDLSSFKFVYDTNEFRIGQKNLLPNQIPNYTNRKPAAAAASAAAVGNTLRRKGYPEGIGTLKNKLNVNYQDDNGKTMIHEACISGSIEIIKVLVEFGAQLDLTDKKGFRPFHYACQFGRTEIVSTLIRLGCNCSEPTVFGKETPLHLAVQYTNPLNNSKTNNETEAIVLLIMKNGGNTSINIPNKAQRMTAFELACELGKTKLVKLILKYCSENYINNLDPNSNPGPISPMHIASFTSQHTSLLTLISKHSPNSIHIAAKNGHNDIIRLLLMYNVTDINQLSARHQGTPLHEACRHGRLQTVKLLLECGCDINSANLLNQLATDVIIKHQKVENDIRCLIKEYSQAVYGVSVQAYLSSHSGALNFEANELVVVLERPAPNSNVNECSEIYSSLGASIYGGVVTNLWRGFILDRRNFTTRSGYFPSSYVNLVDVNEVAGLVKRNGGRLDDSLEIYGNGSVSQKSSMSSPMKSDKGSLNGSVASPNDCQESKNVMELIREGLNDSQIIFSWLSDFNMNQYYQNFVQAGYDLLTIFKSTPADLCAIGIHDPIHRQLIKNNMQRLNISELECKLNYLLTTVTSISDLLRLIHLDQYARAISDQKLFQNLNDFAAKLSWEDLEEIGVNKLGHQKKLMLVAKRLKELNTTTATTKPQPCSLPTSTSNSSQSLENVSQTSSLYSSVNSPRKLDKPIPPKRNLIETSPGVKKTAPSLPPRKSSVISSSGQNSFGTLPKNSRNSPQNHSKQPITNSKANLQITANFPPLKEYFSSSTSSPASSHVSSSGTISPSSTSSSSASNNGFDNNCSNELPGPPAFMIQENNFNRIQKINEHSNQANLNYYYNSMNRFNETKADLEHKYALDKASSRAYMHQNIANIQNTLSYNTADMPDSLHYHQRPQWHHEPEENVLSDIDNMLCDLNKQLDDMLVDERSS